MSTEYDDDDVTNDLTPTFLNPADFPDGTNRTFRITKAEKRTFHTDGQASDGKWILTLDEDQCVGLNKRMLHQVAEWFGRRTRAWIGKAVTVYRDPTVMYQGEVKGGWCLRLPAQHEMPAELETELPDVPF